MGLQRVGGCRALAVMAASLETLYIRVASVDHVLDMSCLPGQGDPGGCWEQWEWAQWVWPQRVGGRRALAAMAASPETLHIDDASAHYVLVMFERLWGQGDASGYREWECLVWVWPAAKWGAAGHWL